MGTYPPITGRRERISSCYVFQMLWSVGALVTVLCNLLSAFSVPSFSRVSTIFLWVLRASHTARRYATVFLPRFFAAEFFSDTVREQFPSHRETGHRPSAQLFFFDLKLQVFLHLFGRYVTFNLTDILFFWCGNIVMHVFSLLIGLGFECFRMFSLIWGHFCLSRT